jgi:hypothetical protein
MTGPLRIRVLRRGDPHEGLELRRRLRALIERWDAHHADWCCTKGCVYPEGRHMSGRFVKAVLDALDDDARRMALKLATAEEALVPCRGDCTCDVGPYIEQLQEVMK